MKPTESLTADDFKALIGQTFTLAHHHALVLREVETRDAPFDDMRAPFSLVFTGPEALKLADVLPLEHDALGAHELLIHRIVSHREARFEIVFN